MSPRKEPPKARCGTARRSAWILGAFAAAVLAGAALFLDPEGILRQSVLRLGPAGAAAAILCMAALSATPVPTEGLLVVFLRVYGLEQGLLYAWTGSTLGSAAIFWVARTYARPALVRRVRPAVLRKIDARVTRLGSVGLLAARLLPLPAVLFNYAASVMVGVRFLDYLWTGAVAMVPYYAGTALLFLGVSRGLWVYAALGLAPLAAVSVLGRLLFGRPEPGKGRETGRREPDIRRNPGGAIDRPRDA